MNTTNIPRQLPSIIHPEDVDVVKSWMAGRPSDPYDQCVNSISRWKYTYVDHGLWSDIRVIDTVVKSEFEVPVPDPSNW